MTRRGNQFMIMRTVLPCLLFFLSTGSPNIHTPQASGNCCGIVQQALKDARNLKIGMARQDIEKYGFAIGGGTAFRDHTVYEYKACDYIKVEIEFTFDKPGPISPKDVIAKVSALEIDYPMKD